MSSEAITQNDLREILSRTVGSIPSEFKKLLWTNPNPSAYFSSQTLSIDLTNYDDIEVTICDFSADATRVNRVTTELCPKGKTTFIVTPYWTTTLGNFSGRAFTPSNTGIVIDEGRNQSGVNNGNAVPLVIYGIKYERVAPPQLDNTLEVASGTVEHSGFNAVTVAGASSSYKTISFGKTFSKIPQVVVQEHNNSLNNYGAIGISVSYVTTTGFNLYAHGVPQSTLSGMSYDWIAMTQIGE